MAALRTLGVNFVIDDFGTGQASLLYLRRLPVQAVKIDRAFVHHLESDVVNRSIVAASSGSTVVRHARSSELPAPSKTCRSSRASSAQAS